MNSCPSTRWLLGIVVALCVGCGESQVEVYPVSGQVTFRGQPADGARVVFHDRRPREQLSGLPIPTGLVGFDGTFQLTSFEAGDGAPAGEYDITVVWPAAVAAEGEDPESVGGDADRLQGRYSDPDTSGLRATVVPGKNELPPIQLRAG